MKMSVLLFIIFLLIVSLIYFGMHWFVYWRIATGLDLSVSIKNIIKFVFLFAAASFFLAQFFRSSPLTIPLGHIGTVWMGVISIALSVFIVQMILSWILPRSVGILTVSAVGLVILLSGYSVLNALRKPIIKIIEIPISKLSEELSGFLIVQLADLHLERGKSARWLNSIVDKTNQLQPDVIVIVGDLTDEDIRGNRSFVDALKRLTSAHGVFAVTGNHEYYHGLEAFFGLCDSLGITVLRNSCVTVANAIEIVGINDETGKGYPGGGPDLDKAMTGCDVTKPVILLSHQPLHFEKAVSKGVDLQLSGHVHAGQIPPMDAIVMFYFKYPYGLYQKGSSFIYTTSGTGIWGPPMRLFSRSEIVKFVLTAKE